MSTTKPNWIQLFGNFVNINQITHIKMCVFGRDCGAGYDFRDEKFYEKFLVIVLACGQRYRIPHKDGDAEDLLNKLGLI